MKHRSANLSTVRIRHVVHSVSTWHKEYLLLYWSSEIRGNITESRWAIITLSFYKYKLDALCCCQHNNVPTGCLGQCMNNFAKDKEKRESDKVVPPDWLMVNLFEIKCVFNKKNQLLEILWFISLTIKLQNSI